MTTWVLYLQGKMACKSISCDIMGLLGIGRWSLRWCLDDYVETCHLGSILGRWRWWVFGNVKNGNDLPAHQVQVTLNPLDESSMEWTYNFFMFISLCCKASVFGFLNWPVPSFLGFTQPPLWETPAFPGAQSRLAGEVCRTDGSSGGG